MGSTRARYIIAIDGGKTYLRRTLAVTHDMTNGEARYATKPVRVSDAPFHVQRAFREVEHIVDQAWVMSGGRDG